ncbi:MAG: hypothetical protein M3P27_06770 [Acidobacteriota bacterium]|nr:hypothetical protein [Acidobacteriota bacterium]
MKRLLPIVAAVIGCGVAFFWLYVSAAVMSGFRMASYWEIVMAVTCPSIYLMGIHWVVVVMGNGILYGGLTWLGVHWFSKARNAKVAH